VKWIDLEVEEDFLEKAKAMFNGQEFDTRVQVPIDLDDRLMLKLCMQAHERDITLNKMIEILLQETIDLHTTYVNESLV
jgi:macrodomain Ter protein organizer (MatP/YcbG family)